MKKEDFRARLAHVLSTPELPLPSIDPQGWVWVQESMEKGTMQKFWVIFIWTKKYLFRLAKNPEESGLEQGVSTSKNSVLWFLCNWILHIRQLLYTKTCFLGPSLWWLIKTQIHLSINYFTIPGKLLEIYPILRSCKKSIDFLIQLWKHEWIHNHQVYFKSINFNPEHKTLAHEKSF